MTPHKHAAVIKAWADGAEIECRSSNGKWWKIGSPAFISTCEYRVKPEPKSIHQIYYEAVFQSLVRSIEWNDLQNSSKEYWISQADRFLKGLAENNFIIKEIR